MNDCLSVVYSCDDNYVRHMSASIYSLLAYNTEFPQIDIYIIANSISVINQEKVISVVSRFNGATIHWIDFSNWKDKLKLNMSWPISLSSYARLFVSDMLPSHVDRILYLDCDMIIMDSLVDLWTIEFTGKLVAAVQDCIGDYTKAAVGLLPDEPYFNAGLLLINLKAWREMKIEKSFLNFIASHDGKVIHHDQGVLNGVLRNECIFLPLRYNVMTIHYMFSRKQMIKYFSDHSVFYEEREILDAKDNPAILHFTPSFTSRPWVKGCKHPLRNKYWDALKNTPWNGCVQDKDTTKWYVRLISWRYRTLPY